MSRIKYVKTVVRCNREIQGEWLRAGETYVMTTRPDKVGSRPSATAHFQSENGATFMSNWAKDRAFREGALSIVEESV